MIRNDIQLHLGEREISFAMDLDPADPRDADLGSYLRNSVVPEPEVVHLMLRTVREGDTVLDAGANLGYFTLLLSRLVGSAGTVLAVEPSGENLKKLYRNIEISQATNIVVNERALWSESGKTLDLHLSQAGGFDSLFENEKSAGKTTVETISLDDLICGSPIRFIKMDVEGAELEILKNQIPSVPFIVAETNCIATRPLRDKMRNAGRSAFLPHHDGSLPSLIPAACRLVPKALNSNLLFSTEQLVAEAWPEVLY